MTTAERNSKLSMVLRVTSGNFLEMFDFFLSGICASYIAKAFFPLSNTYASLLLTFVKRGAATPIVAKLGTKAMSTVPQAIIESVTIRPLRRPIRSI
jgi:hypothetical protein